MLKCDKITYIGGFMKKYLVLILVCLFIFTACGKNSSTFKDDYESINGKANASGKIHREVTIPEDNPFEEVSAEDIVKKIENKDSFYVYFGSRLCPWCRSVIEKACEVSAIRGIAKIYYVDIWDDDGKEILRDKYILDENGKPVLESEGTNEYKKLLAYFDSLLREYNLTTDDGKEISTGEKRIYAPNYFYIENGIPKKLITGKSDKLTDSRGELTEEILNDQTKIFDDFFTEVCDESC